MVHFIQAISTLLLRKLTSIAEEGIVINTYLLHLFKSKMLAFGAYSYLKIMNCSSTTGDVFRPIITKKEVTMS